MQIFLDELNGGKNGAHTRYQFSSFGYYSILTKLGSSKQYEHYTSGEFESELDLPVQTGIIAQ